MALKIKINLKAFFERESKTLISRYRALLTAKKGVSKDPAPHNAPSTIERKGKDHWMMDTGELYKKGFKSEATQYSMRVYASDELHSGRSTYMGVSGGHIGQKPGVKRPRTERRTHINAEPATYEQLFEWHNQQGYSGIFDKLPAGSGMPQRLGKEIRRQMEPQLSKILDKRIEIKVKM